MLDNLKLGVFFDLMGDQPGYDSQTGNDLLRVKRLFRPLTPFEMFWIQFELGFFFHYQTFYGTLGGERGRWGRAAFSINRLSCSGRS